jgi:hypothetical protein
MSAALLACSGGGTDLPDELVPPYPPELADRVEWLGDNAAVLAQITPGSGDFSDLTALQAAIGSARVLC